MADAYVSLMLSFPPEAKELPPKQYNTQIRHFNKQLMDLPVSAWTKQLSKQRNLLEVLNPAVNSIPYLYALIRQIESASKDQERLEQLYPLAAIFLTSCDPIQMRFTGETWQILFKLALEAAVAGKINDLTPFVDAILRLDSSAGTFSWNYLRLVKASLRLGLPRQVLPILDRTIYSYPLAMAKNVPDELLNESHDLSSAYMTFTSGLAGQQRVENVLEYYFLGACIYIGVHKYHRARLFLEYILLSPSIQHGVSIIQAEAYKKWVLLGLLAEGQAYPVPRTADQTVLKSIRSIAKPYDALAFAFEKRDWLRFQADAHTGAEFWIDDGNARLIKDVGDALIRYRVTDLQDTYAALPVSRVAVHLSLDPDATLQLLTEMIQQGHLHADLSSAASEPVLQFRPQSASAAPSSDLEAQRKRIADLVAYIRDADRRLQLTKEYVEHQKRAKRTGGPEGDLADAMDLTWDAPMAPRVDEDGDEDLMSR